MLFKLFNALYYMLFQCSFVIKKRMVLLAIYKLYQVYINVYQFLFGVNIRAKLAYCILQHNYFGLAQLVTFFLTASNGLPRAGPVRDKTTAVSLVPMICYSQWYVHIIFILIRHHTCGIPDHHHSHIPKNY